jgi:hypothetical protein
MGKFVLLLVLCLAITVFALNKPSNYVVSAPGGTRANQIQTLDFAAWNITSGDWQNVIPPNFGGTVYGVVAIGNGLLAYGSITSINGNPAAGLAYYDGNVWAAPEGVGLFSFSSNPYNTSFSYYDNIPASTGTAYGAVVNGNTVYLYGYFDQVGLCRTGVAGLVALNWAAPGIFTVSQIGNGYYRSLNTVPASSPCSFCPADTQPGPGARNKFRTYSNGGNQYFVFQPDSLALAGTGDVWVYQVNGGLWVQVTYGNNALNITGQVADYHVTTDGLQPALYVVGKFQRLNDPVSTNQYLHIAASSDNGGSFQSVTSAITVANFGDIPAVVNQTTGITISPALTGTGFTAIQIPNNNRACIYVAGGYRNNGRTSSVAYANEMQTVVMSVTPSSVSFISARFGVNSPSPATVLNVPNPTIYQLKAAGNNLYVFGNFQYYNQYIPEGSTGERFAVRYTDVYRGAAVISLSSNTVSPAFGGFITAADSDSINAIPNAGSIFDDVSTSNNIYYFASGPNSAVRIGATYGLLSSGILAYGGDSVNNANNRWNTVFKNQRIVVPSFTASQSFGAPYPYAALPSGADGSVFALHITLAQDALIFGGRFDFIGTNRVGGIGFYNPDIGTFGTVGGGLYRYNNVPYYQSDNIYNNRVGGAVADITEWNGYLIAAGIFNRNNSGNALSNIAKIAFRVGGAGWIPIDGGCDNIVQDVLIQGNLLYATGKFSYCGLNSAGYTQTNGLNNGRNPTSGIAVIDLSLDPSVQSWRPLGIGLQGGAGLAMAFYNGKLYVGGTFSSAGGVIASDGIASWDGNQWTSVVANCLGPCDRAVNVLPYNYDPSSQTPTAAERKPARCVALTATNGNLYCVDAGLAALAWWDGSLWHQAGTFIPSGAFIQNNIISNNGSNTGSVLLAGSSSQNSAGGYHYYSYNTGSNNYEPTFTGFSNSILSIVSSNINN